MLTVKFNTPIDLRDQGNIFATAGECSLHSEKTFSGYRLSFNFTLETFKRESAITLMAWEMDFYCVVDNKDYLIGRMSNGLQHENDFPMSCNDGRKHFIRKVIDISTESIIKLMELSHRDNLSVKFEAIPSFRESISPVKDQGWGNVSHSEWIIFLNGLGLDRFELISFKIPITSSHLHAPFSDALGKIRQAELQYTRGDWIGAAASCRSAWRTVLSCAPSGVAPFEHLLSPILGDPERKRFALALVKSLNDVENASVHLEGDQKSGDSSTNLGPEDALLCIHWYASVIGYLSSIN